MPVSVCGFELPDEIAWVAGEERWTAYTEAERLPLAVVEEVFGEAPDSTWKFYDLDEVREVTEEWHEEEDPQWFGSAPHDIEPSKSVLIGELGYDRPFALDFRGDRPVVRLMMIDGRWVQIADSPARLLAALGIEHP